ncbi:TetR/AcrR family transcriptional regulator [Cryptosporangium aurantiacum]|uniref:Transcriptional regulator, TetR family n=1 Tax=Cryptosporangium aurantiacum TaxID=134849 RepID=A0A1M7RKR6_9ACTN|nr:helix-turn-helix domain-containing protein [Cryptosporangium aurantiacum]SHN46935.1 transcriptional regulator, TetR family [Cryptosporangium aurantiacum]
MPYDNRGRAAAAHRTRSAILAAARDSFLESGYAGTTIRAVAEAAGVSQETVYKRFGNKARLLKDVYDVAMAGDEEPVPIAARPQALAVRNAAGPAEAARAYAALSAWLVSRAGDLMRVVSSARGSDPDLDAFMTTVDAERLTGTTMATTAWDERGWLRPGLDRDRARDLVWTLNSPAVWMLLTERGWTNEEYEAWMAGALAALVLAA